VSANMDFQKVSQNRLHRS